MKKLIALIAIMLVSSTYKASAEQQSETLLFTITDVLCNSGVPVNYINSAAPGSLFSIKSDDPYLGTIGNYETTQVLRQQFPANSPVQYILNQDQNKRILFVSTIGNQSSYIGRTPPCPENDRLIIIGKLNHQQ